ncbi:MAG: hypothetical protein IJ772_05270 [Bacilli bacterium]|nr:hypothetical protein [Bacilli bacterium]
MVKIRRLKLKNLAILKEVMKKDEIELNFSDNVFTVIIGRNGSGKSFLLQTLSPSINDNVKNRGGLPDLLDNRIGEKELDIELDGKYLYKIQILYDPKSKTSAYVHKYNMYTNEDLGELNDSGNINTYYDCLEKELGWDKNYLNVGYLSKSVTSIVEMKPGERSQYFTVWLPQISDFIDAYKAVSKKVNIIQRHINTLNQDIGKLSDTDYDIIIENLSREYESLDKSYRDLEAKRTQCTTYLSLIPSFNREEIALRIEKLKNNSRIMNLKRDELLEENKSLSIYSGQKGKELLESTLKKAESEIMILTEKIKNADSNLLNYESEMRELNSEEDLDSSADHFIEIENSLKSIEADIIDLEETRESILKRNPEYKEIEGISKSSVDSFLSFVESLNDIRTKITNLIDTSYLRDNVVLTNSSDKIISLKSEYEKRIDSIDLMVLNYTNRIASLKNSVGLTKELLALRPADCKRDCPIVKSLLRFIDPDEEIKETQEKLDLIIGEKSDINQKLENIKNESQKFALAFSFISEMNSKIVRYKEEIAKFPKYVQDIFANPDTCGILNDIPVLFDKVNGYKEYIYLLEKLMICRESQHNTAITYNLMKQQKNLNEKWAKVHEKWLETSKTRDILIRDLERNQNTEKRLKDINSLSEMNKVKVENYNAEADRLLNEKKTLNDMTKKYYYRNRLLDTKLALDNRIISLKNQISDVNTKLENVKNKRNSMKTLIESRDNLISKKKRYEILANIWSPKVGYPSWEMEEFLDTLTEQTNNDLEKMWGGNLKIHSFEIGANDFKIKIDRNGKILNDVTECSDGEQSTLALAISFAIIEINLRYKKYNVLRFDEVDGPFDDARRRTFMETLVNRIPALDCGNLFIITHNNEFNDAEADLIILDGANEDIDLTNKNIIYHY